MTLFQNKNTNVYSKKIHLPEFWCYQNTMENFSIDHFRSKYYRTYISSVAKFPLFLFQQSLWSNAPRVIMTHIHGVLTFYFKKFIENLLNNSSMITSPCYNMYKILLYSIELTILCHAFKKSKLKAFVIVC